MTQKTKKAGFKPMPPEPPARVQKRFVGKQGRIVLNSLSVEVTISEVRNRYGNVDALVSPIAGSGKVWVRADRLKLTRAK